MYIYIYIINTYVCIYIYIYTWDSLQSTVTCSSPRPWEPPHPSLKLVSSRILRPSSPKSVPCRSPVLHLSCTSTCLPHLMFIVQSLEGSGSLWQCSRPVYASCVVHRHGVRMSRELPAWFPWQCRVYLSCVCVFPGVIWLTFTTNPSQPVLKDRPLTESIQHVAGWSRGYGDSCRDAQTRHLPCRVDTQTQPSTSFGSAPELQRFESEVCLEASSIQTSDHVGVGRREGFGFQRHAKRNSAACGCFGVISINYGSMSISSGSISVGSGSISVGSGSFFQFWLYIGRFRFHYEKWPGECSEGRDCLFCHMAPHNMCIYIYIYICMYAQSTY